MRCVSDSDMSVSVSELHPDTEEPAVGPPDTAGTSGVKQLGHYSLLLNDAGSSLGSLTQLPSNQVTNQHLSS